MARYKDIPQKGMPLPGDLHIRFKGVWDMQELYDAAINYLRDRKYKFHEKIYKHKAPSPFGVERQYIWEAEQLIDDWMEVTFNIYIHTYDAHDIDVHDNNGEKKTLTKGKIWVVIRLTSSWDPKKDFDRNSFFGQLKAFYMNYIYRRRLLEGGFHRRFRTEQSGLYQVMLRTLKSERRDFEDAYQQGVHIRA
ncbi:hypothetical protein J4401_01425 [Candidatus Woesearchaeota archaeon]|nr:hypothetical protein [Candidatus Woesearchaeota archaeon]